MSCTWAVMPVRALQGGKQRLAPQLDASGRAALCTALLADALAALQQCRLLAGVLVVSADAAAIALARQAGVTVLQETGNGGLNAAVQQGAAWVQAHGADSLLVMHADLPLVTAAAIDAAITAHRSLGPMACTLVPDRHGQGTNVLLATPPTALPFCFGEDSLRRHQAVAAGQGLPCRVWPDARLACDLDTPDDLAALAAVQPLPQGQAIDCLRALSVLAAP